MRRHKKPVGCEDAPLRLMTLSESFLSLELRRVGEMLHLWRVGMKVRITLDQLLEMSKTVRDISVQDCTRYVCVRLCKFVV